MKPEKNGSVRTYTVTGAPHYTAPEIVAGKGYGLLSDIWSIGICMYEIIFASVPFGDELEDPYAIYEEILSKPLKFPKEAKDKKVVQLLKQLLSKKPEERMPSSFAGLKSDPFFEGFNWVRTRILAYF